MPQLNDLLSQLWEDYRSLNPIADQVHQLLQGAGEEVINDHVAFRTFNDPRIGVDTFGKFFLDLGYQAGGEYHFKEKKLFARHYEPPQAELPKIFVSELKVEEFSSETQKIIQTLIEQVPQDATQTSDFLSSGRPWKTDYQTYQKLAEVSEYAAWMSAFGFRVNHFTVNVNALHRFQTVEEINTFLKSHQIPLNTSGGEIKGGPDVYLEQSSTLANVIPVEFSDGTFEIPACYYEFAKRFPLENGDLYQGFVEKSADKIFESTDRK